MFGPNFAILAGMKIIVAHTSPDWDAIGALWLIRKFLPGWKDAVLEFVPAGTRSERIKHIKEPSTTDPVIEVNGDEIIHVDTGLLPLDHHHTSDKSICATTLAWDYVRQQLYQSGEKLTPEHDEAVSRIVKVIVQIDHFREVFWDNPTADYHEFSLIGVLEGLKFANQDQDQLYADFGIQCLDSLVHEFENRIWAEREIKEKGIEFTLSTGLKAIGFETLNDTVIKLSQKMGYILVLRKDPRKGYVRIKLRPETNENDNLDLTLAYEKLKKIDPEATWFLHVSKKMLLNGTPKNPKMIPSKLSLTQLIEVLKSIY